MDQDALSEIIVAKTNDAALAAFISAKTEIDAMLERLGAIIGRFVLTAAADFVGRRKVFLLCCTATSASMLLWAVARSEPTLQGFALCFGALQGGFVALLPAFVADTFGAHALGKRLGVLYTSRGVALLVGPPALVLGISDLADYALPLIIAAFLGLIGAALLAAELWSKLGDES